MFSIRSLFSRIFAVPERRTQMPGSLASVRKSGLSTHGKRPRTIRKAFKGSDLPTSAYRSEVPCQQP